MFSAKIFPAAKMFIKESYSIEARIGFSKNAETLLSMPTSWPIELTRITGNSFSLREFRISFISISPSISGIS